jgi:hypothetical protein
VLPKIVANVIGGELNSGAMGNELEGGVNKSISIWSSKCRVSKGSFESLDEGGLNAEENLTTAAEELDAFSSSPKSSNSSTYSSELYSGSACFACEHLLFPLLFGDGGRG